MLLGSIWESATPLCMDVITKCDKKYYEMWQLLQSVTVTTKFNRKLLQSVTGITKFDRKLLQGVTVLQVWQEVIAKGDRYYKVWQLLQSGT